MTLSQLWHDVARHELRWVNSWRIKATIVRVELPLSGQVSAEARRPGMFSFAPKPGWNSPKY
ncbi:MAG: hypothetical protein PHI97_20235 [Desulfobulbus sp.]|nr:hypothetical protein [Desulfobulbus sp.]